MSTVFAIIIRTGEYGCADHATVAVATDETRAVQFAAELCAAIALPYRKHKPGEDYEWTLGDMKHATNALWAAAPHLTERFYVHVTGATVAVVPIPRIE